MKSMSECISNWTRAVLSMGLAAMSAPVLKAWNYWFCFTARCGDDCVSATARTGSGICLVARRKEKVLARANMELETFQ